MNNAYIYPISNHQYIQLTPDHQHNEGECSQCLVVNLDYIDKESNTTIRFGRKEVPDLCFFMTEYGYIQKLINNELVLDKTTMGDPGLEWNKDFENYRGKKELNKFYFAGNGHTDQMPRYDAWLYNDTQNNVILEITPHYSYHTPEKITSEQFINEYKPTVQVKIPKENLELWIKKTLEIRKTLP